MQPVAASMSRPVADGEAVGQRRPLIARGVAGDGRGAGWQWRQTYVPAPGGDQSS